MKDFEMNSQIKHINGDTGHAKEYAMAVLMIEAHAALWGEKV